MLDYSRTGTSHRRSFATLRAATWIAVALFWLPIAAQRIEPKSASPVVINAPQSSRPGDVVGIYGENFGANPVVTLLSTAYASGAVLPLLNQWGERWISFKIPEHSRGALMVRISNGDSSSQPVKLNAARAFHLDALQITPGGAFRVFGRNLLSSGFAPTVAVNGLRAVVDEAASDEHMLVVTAPQELQVNAKAHITVDNGNGTGSDALDRAVTVASGGATDTYGLGVGWAMAFSGKVAKPFVPSSSSSSHKKILCDGISDDTVAMQMAIDAISDAGGGVLVLPEGQCNLSGSVKLKSKVVIQGAGKHATVISYASNYPIWARGIDLAGLRDLSLTNTHPGIESALIQKSSRIFLQNVRFSLGGGVHMFLTDNRNFVVANCDFLQPKNFKGYGPYYFGGSGGLVFADNTTTFADGAAAFSNVHDAYIVGNRFTRDAQENQSSKTVTHTLTMDFAHRMAIIGNTFDVLGGPIVNKLRNDGETLLTEGGGGKGTGSLGAVTAATPNTLTDASNVINVNPFSPGEIPENFAVAIVGGRGAGQSRRVTAYSGGTLTIHGAWDVVPDTSSRYATFVWGLEKSLIKGNTLSQNPRGIWLYQTAVKEVDIVENTIREGGGIYLRAAQNIKNKLFTPMSNIRIAKNFIENSTSQWRSYISVMFVRMDLPEFGIGTIGIEVRDNILRANRPNLVQAQEESGAAEGFVNRMHAEGPSQSLDKNQTRLLGTVFQRNTCIDCNIGLIVRDGAKATVLDGNLNHASHD